jgi:hypothetical protein
MVDKMQTKTSVGQVIDDLYSKERKYVGNKDKDNFLNFRSPIFELQKYHNLKANPHCLESVEEL